MPRTRVPAWSTMLPLSGSAACSSAQHPSGTTYILRIAYAMPFLCLCRPSKSATSHAPRSTMQPDAHLIHTHNITFRRSFVTRFCAYWLGAWGWPESDGPPAHTRTPSRNGSAILCGNRFPSASLPQLRCAFCRHRVVLPIIKCNGFDDRLSL